MILSIEQAAQRCPLSLSTLYKLAQNGEAPFRKVRGKWGTTEKQLEDWWMGEQKKAEPKERSFKGNVDELAARRSA